MFLNTLPIIIIALLKWNGIGASQSWNGWSPNDNNDRYRREPLPVTLPVRKTEFKQLWYTKLNGPVTMTPTVYQNRVYVSTLPGTFYCLQADNGNIVWQKNFSSIVNNGYAYYLRNSPLFYKKMIILGLTDVNVPNLTPGNGTFVAAFNALTGTLQWNTRISSHPASQVTSIPQVANDRVFIGISSFEEGFAQDPTYPCCSFQGSVVALNVSTGKFLWETKMIPDNNGSTTGYSGKLKRKIDLFLRYI